MPQQILSYQQDETKERNLNRRNEKWGDKRTSWNEFILFWTCVYTGIAQSLGNPCLKETPILFHPFRVPVGPISKKVETAGACSRPAEGTLGAELRTLVGNSGRTISTFFTRGLAGDIWTLCADLKDRWWLVLLALSHRILLMVQLNCWRPHFPAQAFFPLARKKMTNWSFRDKESGNVTPKLLHRKTAKNWEIRKRLTRFRVSEIVKAVWARSPFCLPHPQKNIYIKKNKKSGGRYRWSPNNDIKWTLN